MTAFVIMDERTVDILNFVELAWLACCAPAYNLAVVGYLIKVTGVRAAEIQPSTLNTTWTRHKNLRLHFHLLSDTTAPRAPRNYACPTHSPSSRSSSLHHLQRRTSGNHPDNPRPRLPSFLPDAGRSALHPLSPFEHRQAQGKSLLPPSQNRREPDLWAWRWPDSVPEGQTAFGSYRVE